jgi:hypothetical protein
LDKKCLGILLPSLQISWVSVMRLGAEWRDVIGSVTASKQPENVKNDCIMATILLKT